MKKVWLLICAIVTVTRGFFRYRPLKLLAIKLASSSAVFPCAVTGPRYAILIVPEAVTRRVRQLGRAIHLYIDHIARVDQIIFTYIGDGAVTPGVSGALLGARRPPAPDNPSDLPSQARAPECIIGQLS